MWTRLIVIVVFVSGLVLTAGAQEVTEIIDQSGDGSGHTLGFATGVALDGEGNVFVTGGATNNAFKIAPGGIITQILDATGNGEGEGDTLEYPTGVTIDVPGNIAVLGSASNNVFTISADGTISQVNDASGDVPGTSWTARLTSRSTPTATSTYPRPEATMSSRSLRVSSATILKRVTLRRGPKLPGKFDRSRPVISARYEFHKSRRRPR